jgi:hypothetical protein
MKAASDLGRSERAAHATDPWAAFGLGRAGFDEQKNISEAGAQLQSTQDRDATFAGDNTAFRQFNEAKNRRLGLQNLPGFVSGGAVHHGSDNILAYLSNGEFVMSRAAVQTIGQGNLERANHYANGGAVSYMAKGEVALAGGQARGQPQGLGLGESLAKFGEATGVLATAFTTFGVQANSLAAALSKFPSTLAISGKMDLNVIFNGAEVLARMSEGLAALVEEKVRGGIQKMMKDKLPDA